jgi:hypothetical protein
MNTKKMLLVFVGVGLSTFFAGAAVYSAGRPETMPVSPAPVVSVAPEPQNSQRHVIQSNEFDVQVLVDGRPLDEYDAKGRTYIQATEGSEYEVRIRNPFPFRVAVALSVDGLNSIDARHTSAWAASKWVIGPYQTIEVSGWQVSSARARHFYFTTERDSYGAKLGQTANLGVISAVFFSERRPLPVQVTPPQTRSKQPPYEDERAGSRGVDKDSASSSAAPRKTEKSGSYPGPDDESAATGIGRSVTNDVQWVNLQLEPNPVSQVTIRYEYYQGLVRLGIMPRPYPRPDTLRRREGARGFEDRRFSPEP